MRKTKVSAHTSCSRRTFLKSSGALASSAFGIVACKARVSETSGAISETAVRQLQTELGGRLVLPDDEDYEAARHIWNGLIDKRPWGIARCTDPSDIRRCIDFAQRHDLPVAVRGGGHHAAGFATIDDGLVIDLSRMIDADLDTDNESVRVGPGVRVGRVHEVTRESGLVLPTGTVSMIGLPGLTLGGGEGWFAPKFGLTCDSVLSADVVTAEGDVVRCSATEKPDLFWGLRGGGGNLGVVTSLTFRLHRLEGLVSGLIMYPPSEARDALRHWRDQMAHATDDLSSAVFFIQAPAPIFAVAVAHLGPESSADSVLDPLRSYGNPAADTVRRKSNLELHTEAESMPGSANYWRSHYCRTMSDEAIETFIASCLAAKSPESRAFLWSFHGAIGRVPAADTAYPHRDAAYMLGIFARWPVADNGDPHVAWAREFWRAMQPFATGEIYANWSSEVGPAVGRQAYGDNFTRLARLKRQYDPQNFFRSNVNVAPEE